MHARSLILLAALLTPALHAQARILERPQLGSFATPQAAVDAATSGDTILVKSGSYGPLVIEGKGLQLVAPPDQTVHVQGIEVVDVPEGCLLLVSGLTSTGVESFPTSSPGLRVKGCAGFVRIQDCVLHGPAGTDQFWDQGNGGHGARVSGSPRTTLQGCVLVGGDGFGNNAAFEGDAGSGGHGLISTSPIALHACTLTGGEGATSGTSGGDGGSGAVLSGADSLASRCHFEGSDAGHANDFLVSWGGNGGHGVDAQAGAVRLIGCTYAFGQAGSGWTTDGKPGKKINQGGGQVTNDAGSVPRWIQAPELVGDDQTIPFQVHGQSGDAVYLLDSPHPGFHPAPQDRGTRHTRVPELHLASPLGFLQGDSKTFDLDLPSAGGIAEHHSVQVLVVDVFGQRYLSGVETLVVLDRDAAPDCNGNGQLDYLDVAQGLSADADEDWLPDECGQTTWWVDPTALPGGDGSSLFPFQTILAARNAAGIDDVVVLRDGLYTGPGNRDIGFLERMTVRSENGPASCILDCEGASRALWFSDGPSVLEGIAVHNATASFGAGLYADSDAPMLVRDCVFVDCHATDEGGGILSLARMNVQDCSFVRCSAVEEGGGIVLNLTSTTPSLLRGCNFSECSARDGAGMFLRGDESVVVSHSSFTLGDALLTGGGIAILRESIDGLYGEQPLIHNCRFLLNTAQYGGGLYGSEGSSCFHASNCSFQGNLATAAGGAVALFGLGDETARVSNSILWGNTSPSGAGLALVNDGRVWVSHSNLEGGQQGVHVGASSQLHWLGGNLDSDPLFANAHLFLSAGSACIDAGHNGRMLLDFTDVDEDGKTREAVSLDVVFQPRLVDDPNTLDTGTGAGPLVDMGAIEFQE